MSRAVAVTPEDALVHMMCEAHDFRRSIAFPSRFLSKVADRFFNASGSNIIAQEQPIFSGYVKPLVVRAGSGGDEVRLVCRRGGVPNVVCLCVVSLKCPENRTGQVHEERNRTSGHDHQAAWWCVERDYRVDGPAGYGLIRGWGGHQGRADGGRSDRC